MQTAVCGSLQAIVQQVVDVAPVCPRTFMHVNIIHKLIWMLFGSACNERECSREPMLLGVLHEISCEMI